MFDKSAYMKRYRLEHYDKILSAIRKWQSENRDKIKVHNTKNNPVNNPIYRPRRIRFKGKQIYLKQNPRTGVCSKCGSTDKTTAMHHIQCHPEDPLKDTIELCLSCHRKEHVRLNKIK